MRYPRARAVTRRLPAPDGLLAGTDGFGRSDTRASLRRHFHIDPESIAVAVLTELARRGEVDADLEQQAVKKYDLLSEQLPASKDTTEGSSE